MTRRKRRPLRPSPPFDGGAALARKAIDPALDRLLTVREAAHILGLSRQSLYRMVERGDLPFWQGQRMVRVRESDVRRLVRGAGLLRKARGGRRRKP